MKLAAIRTAVFLALVVSATADGLVTVASKDKTSSEIPLTFVVEKTKMVGEYCQIWGTVRNTGSKAYKRVSVVITLKQGDVFLSREAKLTEPDMIGPGEVGYIHGSYITCEGRTPTVLEYTVTAEK